MKKDKKSKSEINEKLKPVLNYRINQGFEFLIGNILLIAGGALIFLIPPLGIFAIGLGLVLDYRVFFQTLFDIENAQKNIEETEERIKKTKNNVSEMSEEIFGRNSSPGLFNIPNISSSVPDLSEIFNPKLRGNQALEDKINENKRENYRINERLDELEDKIEKLEPDSS